MCVTALAVVILSLTHCQSSEEASAEALYGQYCGSCHQLPSPGDLSKDLWITRVLPEMGARLGVQAGAYNPVNGLGIEEAYYIERTQVYPKTPLLSESEWDSIYNYVISLAPDSLPVDTVRKHRSVPLKQFSVHKIGIDRMNGARVTSLNCTGPENGCWIGTGTGEWFSWSGTDTSRMVNLFASPISGFDGQGSEQLVLEMGNLNPSDVPRGKLWLFRNGRQQLLAEGLYRPVFAKRTDLNQDGTAEYLVCEFGNRVGMLSLIEGRDESYSKRVLVNQPGMIRVELADMNEDGREDIIALAGQGDEGIYVLFNQGDGKFSREQVIQLPPVYGSSWFELFDYDGDGDLDIAVVNGDNADFTFILKPYHGFRLYLNDGSSNFTEAFFYPVYGATRVIARDFDRDGDQDFAIAAIFPDFEHNAGESFIYLENEEAAAFRFQSYTSAATLEGHPLIMESNDVDKDGDLDILLGLYVGSPAPVPDSLPQRWMRQNVDLLWLENRIGEEPL